MDIAHSIPTTVKSVSFSFLSPQETRRVSVKQITNPQLLDELNRPTRGGLYDPSLGPVTKQDLCGTCRLTYFTCPGHYGHIDLPAPVFHPLFLTDMYKVFNGMCMFCHKFKAKPILKAKYIAQLRLLDHGLVDAALSVDDILREVEPEEADPDDDKADEPVGGASSGIEALQKRLDEHVKSHLRRASGSRRDDYHDGVAYQMRKKIFKQFLELKSKGCHSCGAKAYTFRKEGFTKIIEYDLMQKSKTQNLLIGLVRPKVLGVQTTDHRPSSGATDDDVEMESDEDEGAGESIEHSDDDETPRPTSRLAAQENDGVAVDYQGKVKGRGGRSERLIAPEEARAHLRLLFSNESVICSLIFGRHGSLSPTTPGSDLSPASADMFFIEVIAVPPTRFRPPADREGTLMEHPQNTLLTKVLNTSYRIRDLSQELKAESTKDAERITLPDERNRIIGGLLHHMVQLQIDVNSFLDSNKNPTILKQGQLPIPGVKNILEKKEGLFRKNMMGKRVNYAARSVISPDVNIESNEIGIPPVFAKKLTFPEPVTQHNVHLMRQLVINGPKNYPGASIIQFEDGSQQSLERLTQEQRIALANQLLTPQEGNRAMNTSHTLTTRTIGSNKKVYRHLRDGDCLILNRQPTLHKPSMMVHKARVLRGEKTIRMHYANCNSYNADFDGDEMNIHFPQSQVSRAEAKFIANTDNQYLVPTSGNPLRGLIQDHVVAGVWMTYKETFFTREEYQQIIYGALKPEDNYTGGGRVITVPPAIWKPRALWTGKQIISTIMKNITPETAAGMHLHSQSKILNSHWGNYSYEKKIEFRDGSKMTMRLDGDQTVIFYDGDLLCGVLDKSQYGATAYGMVHSVYELYGPDVAGRLLSILSRLFTKFLQHRGFTCRMDDLCLTPEGDRVRKEKINDAKGLGYEAAVQNFPALKDLEANSPGLTKQLNVLLEEVLRDDSKMNDLDVTVKKKMAELTQKIASAAITNGLYRRFPDNHMQTMVMSGAKGSAVNARQISCGLGQTELEGRRVPMMVSGKTLPSFKPLETAAIAGGYIASRFLTGVKPQEFYFHCMAGREGLIDTAVKTSRSGYLQRCLIKHLEGLRVHYDNTVRGSDSAIYQFLYGGDGLDVTKQMHLTEFDFAAMNTLSLVDRTNPKSVIGKVDDEEAVKYMKKVLKHSDNPNKYPPSLSVYPPTKYLGSTSETFAKAVDKYVKNNVGKTLKAKKPDPNDGSKRKDLMSAARFRDLMNVRYMKALTEPGEAIGLLAAQGVGEPSTQMTLNTFHFAGHGAANVTLGIPRLREIVMTASKKPQTPTMTLPIKEGVSKDRVQQFCKKASRLTLSEVVDNVIVTERLVREGGERRKTFGVKLELFPPSQYQKEYLVQPKEILDALATSFPAVLKKEIRKELKKLGETLESQKNVGQGKKSSDAPRGGGDGDDDDGPSMPGAGDADSDLDDVEAEDEKTLQRKKELDSYDDNESEGEGDGDSISDQDEIKLPHESDEESEDDEAAAKKVQQKAKWEKRLITARDLFNTSASPFAFNLNFPRSGEACTFEIEFGGETQKVLLVGIIERVCVQTIIRHIPGVARCREFIPEKKTEGPKFMTEGSNLKGLWKYCQDEGDLDQLESNDIAAVLNTYGVEAARDTIIREMSSVFGVYNIKVDPRHLTIIADYMTFDGGFKPFNRNGIATSSSVLLKASYEMTGSFLADATLYGDFDELTSPASCIVLGQPPRNGTGIFGVQAPIPVSA